MNLQGPAADESRLFLPAAYEGAQVRTLVNLAHRVDLRGLDPRSVIVVAADELAARCAGAAADLHAPLRVPVVVTRGLPAYAGPLDLVVVLGEPDAEAGVALEEACAVAARRGCPIVLAGPADGPLIEDAPDSAVVLEPPAGASGDSPARAFGTVHTALELLHRDAAPVTEALSMTADLVDEELQSLVPERDEVVNPARNLAAAVEGHRVMHTGLDRTGRAVAGVVAALWSSRGVYSGVTGPAELAATAPVRDIFHDPLIDGDDGVIPLRVVVWAAKESGLPDSIAQDAPEDAATGPAARALRLITRGFAATAFHRR